MRIKRRHDHPLEEEGIPEIAGDGNESLMAPEDEPVGADEYGTTAGEMHRGEPQAWKLQREGPDIEDEPRVGLDPVDEPPVGRLVDDRVLGRDDEKGAWAEDSNDFEALTAEEEAVHEVEE